MPEPTPVEVLADFEPLRIRQARGLRGWSRGELAERLDVHPQRVAGWESAVGTLRPLELVRMAELLEVPVAFFKRGRPMVVLDSSEVWVCEVDR